ncbi:hypothetical protein PHYPSEUDO_008660 [Phytophthora pseudosyringae]|uniref:RING-type domain-containing protein n=1 Tax=Phytophthora pseudosyringae TaxID=221518 RepID=A0A8T1VDT8_9STRA|nr:hypothetical protein PHYPSEUDO_008660 [Phytophthora pseudosyringae]
MVNASPVPADDGGGSPTSCSASFSTEPGVHGTADVLGVGSLQSFDPTRQRSAATRGEQQLPILIEQRLRDLLGEPLSDVDRASVRLAPLRPCLPGEIVAVVNSDGVLRYGKVRDEEEPSGGGEVKVQVSKACIRWYAVSQIYFFQSVEVRKDVDVWTKDSALQGEGATASTAGVIAEVNTLLARLNVSLSTSYEELLAEMLRLQHRAALAEEDRRAALKQVEQALREKRDAETALTCVVCLVSPVGRVLIPCGHSFCSTCVRRLHRDACPVCRQEVTDSAAFRVS